jgi:hypothetical protein
MDKQRKRLIKQNAKVRKAKAYFLQEARKAGIRGDDVWFVIKGQESQLYDNPISYLASKVRIGDLKANTVYKYHDTGIEPIIIDKPNLAEDAWYQLGLVAVFI